MNNLIREIKQAKFNKGNLQNNFYDYLFFYIKKQEPRLRRALTKKSDFEDNDSLRNAKPHCLY